jgi:hypothetical protein
MSISSVLVQDQLCRVPLAIDDESDLCIHNFQKIVAIAFGKDLKFRLAGGLLKEVIAVSRNSDNEVRCQLVPSDVTVEQLRINCDLLMLLRRQQRNAGIEQMPPDVINTLRRFSV